jgi:FtsP/CotA-like multicopper oxidase with cupredoxin domain
MVFSELMDMYQDEQGTWQMTSELFVDGFTWMADHAAGPSQPEAPSAVHARVGDTIDWEFRNESHMAHPLHLHGFSFQPLSWRHTDEEADTVTTWPASHTELEDTILLPGETSVFVRVRLDDPVGNGGAVGRWMRHCHILQHGEAGMMSELVVDP